MGCRGNGLGFFHNSTANGASFYSCFSRSFTGGIYSANNFYGVFFFLYGFAGSENKATLVTIPQGSFSCFRAGGFYCRSFGRMMTSCWNFNLLFQNFATGFAVTSGGFSRYCTGGGYLFVCCFFVTGISTCADNIFPQRAQ